MIWATVSSWSCFCLQYRASPSLATKNIINLILVLIIWWCPFIESSLVLLKEAVFMTNVFSWQNFVIFCPVSFCAPRLNLPVTPGISWLPTFAFPSPIMKRTSFFFFLVLVLEGIGGLHRTVWLQPLWHYWLGHRLGLLWCWWFALEVNQDPTWNHTI